MSDAAPEPRQAISRAHATKGLRPILGGAMVGALVGLALVSGLGDAFRLPTVGTWFALPVLLTAMLVVLAAHELGHVVAGALVRFRFVMLVVGPVRVVRELEGLHIGLNRDAALIGGVAMSVPRDDVNLFQRLALVYAGGPIASALLALVGFGILMTVERPPATLPLVVLGATSATSALIAIATLIPMPVGPFKSDGYQLRRLLRRGPEAEQVCDTVLLIGQAFDVRPRDYDPRLVDRLLDPAKPDGGLSGLGHQHALDRLDHETAEVWLAQMLRETPALPRTLQPGSWLWAAIHRARVNGDAGEARRLREAGKGPSLFDVTAIRALADAEILAAEGQHARAAAVARSQLESGRPLQTEVRERFEQLSAG